MLYENIDSTYSFIIQGQSECCSGRKLGNSLTEVESLLTSIINIFIHNMFENRSDISINENKSEMAIPAERSSLPFIHDKLISRGELTKSIHLPKKQSLKLPSIHAAANLPRQHRNATQPDQSGPKQQLRFDDGHLHKKNTFARQVEERMRLVVGEMENKNYPSLTEDYESDDFDFEAKVNANKELIKMHRAKNERKKVPNSVIDQRAPIPPSNSISKGHSRKESILQKKSQPKIPDNKSRSKRKSMKEKVTPKKMHVQESLKQINSKDYASIKYHSGNKNMEEKNRVRSQKVSGKKLQIGQSSKNINLFDGIQNYLENPHKNHKEVSNQLVGLTLLKAKRDIEDKLKIIDQRLGTKEEDEGKSPATTNNSYESGEVKPELGEKSWRRIRIQGQGQGVECEESNFDKQLDRVTELQDKNGQSLDQYLEYQQIKMQLELLKQKKK